MGRVCTSLASLITLVLATTSEHQTCFSLDGSVSAETYRCDNSTTGHSTCCAAGHICWSNGVCEVPETLSTHDYVREGCTDYSWNDPACFDVCPWFLLGDGAGSVGVRPCNGISESNIYCCDDGSTGIGSYACCNNESSLFAYDNITSLPTILATIPLGGVSSSTISPTAITITSVQLTTSTIFATSSADDESSSNISNSSVGLGAGLGVGLPVAAAIIGGTWWAIWQSRRKQLGIEKEKQHAIPGDTSNFNGQSQYISSPQELPGY